MMSRSALIAALGAVAALVALDAVPALAQQGPIYPWCLEYGELGMTNCYFSTWEQCQGAGRGNGGLCYMNPFYTAAMPASPETPATPKRRHRR